MADVPFDPADLTPDHPQDEETLPPPPDPDHLPLPQEGKGSRAWWTSQLDAAIDRLKLQKTDWDRNVESYRTKTLNSLPDTDTVVVPRDFSFVEQKKAQLFFQVPEVHLTPMQPELRDSVLVFQAVVNHYLGEDATNALAMMNEVAFDALCPSGLMCSRIGYETFTGGSVPEDPNNPLSAPVPNIVRDRYFWERISPASVLIPHNFNGSIYDKAPWLGYRYEDDWDAIRLRYHLAPDTAKPASRKRTGTSTDDDLLLKGEAQASRQTGRADSHRSLVIELWYRCAYFFPDQEADPEVFYQLVLCDGMDEPLLHRKSPLQSRTQDGQLTGMLGNPIHIRALRYVSDTAYPPSECTISRTTNDELNKSRTQMLLQRDRSTPMRLADTNRIGGESGLEKLRKNIYQSIIGLPGYDPNNPPIGAVSTSAFPRENFTFNDYLDRDLGEIWAMGSNQRGQQTSTQLSATEIARIDQWANTRLDAERRQMLRYFVAGVRKLASLIQLFASETQYVEILGPDKVKRLEAWNKDRIQGQFAFKANPDSAIRIDEAQARTQSLKLYEMLAKDPNVNRVELLYQICEHWNLDPATVVIPQLPPKGPDPANVSFRFNAADIDVRNPNFPIYLSILKQAGYTLDQPDPNSGEPSPVQQALHYSQFQAEVMASADTGRPPTTSPPQFHQVGGNGHRAPMEHEGPAPQADHLSKHRARETGKPEGRHPLGEQ